MRPALTGEEQKVQHKYLYWAYGHCRPLYTQAVRTGDWKGVRNGKDAPLELYDLKNDLGETKDVAAANPEVVKRIEDIMQEAVTPSAEYPIGEIYQVTR